MSNRAEVLEVFLDLCAEAETVDADMEKAVEPVFAKILAYIHAHPECRAEFGVVFLSILRGTIVAPPQLVEFCMHALRWEDFRARIEAWLAIEKSGRIRNFLEDVLDAYTDKWHSRDFYETFNR